MNARAPIDPRVWLLWGIALSLPPMLGRNPFPLLACLIVALTVRSAMSDRADAAWGRLIRLALIFAIIGVLFNLVTYHGGDREFAVVPGWIPIAGGPLTINAVVFGVLSGLALVVLVVTWSTVAQHLDWTDLVRLAPPALAGMTISGAIAMTLVPKTIEAFGDIRDAQAIRGFKPRGARDIIPLAAPLLTLGLERAVTMSEALESRGFGGPAGKPARSRLLQLGLPVGLTTMAAAAFLVASGEGGTGLSLFLAGTALIVVVIRRVSGAGSWKPTRYREVVFRRSDAVLGCLFGAVIVALLAAHNLAPNALMYEAYPTIGWPAVNLPVIGLIGVLLAPLLVPIAPNTRSGS